MFIYAQQQRPQTVADIHDDFCSKLLMKTSCDVIMYQTCTLFCVQIIFHLITSRWFLLLQKKNPLVDSKLFSTYLRH